MKVEKPKIIFMGTPDFAVPSLVSIHNIYGLSAVVTVPDKSKGRGLKVAFSPVKTKALELDIPLLQPESLKDDTFLEEIKKISPDIIVVIAFRILPESVFKSSKLGTFNIHGSLLPKYRGAAPINWAIIKGEKQTGLTSFLLDSNIDTGNILLTYHCEITEDMTAGELHDKLMPEAAELSLKTIELLLNGNYEAHKQDNSKASPAPKIFKETCKIDWKKKSNEIRNFINGLSPYPAAWTLINNKQYKIIRVKINHKILEPDTYQIDNNQLFIGTLDGSVEILELQPENKRPMKTADFLNGWREPKEGKL